MARVQTEYQGSSEELRAVGMPMVQAVAGRMGDSAAQKAARLAEAFGVGAKIAQDYEQQQVEKQKDKINYYVETFKKDYQGGAVSQAQVRERFPETVPIIAAKIAEVVGQQEAEKKWGNIVEEIQGNDTLRLDSAARNAFIEQKRKELFGEIPKGNDFYANGYVQGMNALTKQYEYNWRNETAAYHQKVQQEGFTKDVTTALYSGGDISQIDSNWGKSSSLNNIERKKLVADTAVDVALASRDPSVLDRIPTVFRNADINAKFEQAKVRITELKMAELRNAKTVDDWQREQNIRVGKQEIVSQLAGGGSPDPTKYANQPELFQFAIQMRDMPVLDESLAKANSNQIRSSILNQSSVTGVDIKKVEQDILMSRSINYKDKVELMKELPKLIEGNRMMSEDSDVKGAMSMRLTPLLEALEKTPTYQVAMLQGVNVRQSVMSGFQQNINSYFKAYYEETGSWPTGFKKMELVDKAVAQAEAQFKSLADIRNLKANTQGSSPSAPQAQPKPAQGVRKFNPATGQIE